MGTFKDEAIAALTPTEEQIAAKERELIETKKEQLARDKQSISDRRASLDQEEAGFAAREQELIDASNSLESETPAEVATDATEVGQG